MIAVNRNKPDKWKEDIVQSVDMYNDWFLQFAPEAYRTTRVQTTMDVEKALKATNNLRDISVALLRENPSVLPTLRMSTCPPLAVDRLIGLAGVSKNLVKVMEKEKKLPLQMPDNELVRDLKKIGEIICGYFDTGYLGYEAAEGIDWVWEHRIDDLREFGL